MSFQDLTALALIALIVYMFFSGWGMNHSGKPDNARAKEDKRG